MDILANFKDAKFFVFDPNLDFDIYVNKDASELSLT